MDKDEIIKCLNKVLKSYEVKISTTDENISDSLSKMLKNSLFTEDVILSIILAFEELRSKSPVAAEGILKDWNCKDEREWIEKIKVEAYQRETNGLKLVIKYFWNMLRKLWLTYGFPHTVSIPLKSEIRIINKKTNEIIFSAPLEVNLSILDTDALRR